MFLWPHYSGAPGALGPRFIEPPEPPVPMPLNGSSIGNDSNHRHEYLECEKC